MINIWTCVRSVFIDLWKNKKISTANTENRTIWKPFDSHCKSCKNKWINGIQKRTKTFSSKCVSASLENNHIHKTGSKFRISVSIQALARRIGNHALYYVDLTNCSFCIFDLYMYIKLAHSIYRIWIKKLFYVNIKKSQGTNPVNGDAIKHNHFSKSIFQGIYNN